MTKAVTVADNEQSCNDWQVFKNKQANNNNKPETMELSSHQGLLRCA